MNYNLKTVVFASGAVAVVGSAIADYVKTHRTERAKRAKIQEDLDLDLSAIKRAGEVSAERMSNGHFRFGLAHVIDDLRNEIEFQKIAIREED